jgi:hypothetical protein
MLALYRELIAARRRFPVLRAVDAVQRSVDLTGSQVRITTRGADQTAILTLDFDASSGGFELVVDREVVLA